MTSKSWIVTLTVITALLTAYGCGGMEYDEGEHSDEGEHQYEGEQQYEVALPPKMPLPPPGTGDPGLPDERPSLCGNQRCDQDDGETCLTCAADCGKCVLSPETKCGDWVCHSSAGETCNSCPKDCGSCCGNGVCDYGETYASCMADCTKPTTWKTVMAGWCRSTSPNYVSWSGGSKPTGTVWATIKILPGLPDQIWAKYGMALVPGVLMYSPWYLLYQHNKPIKRIISDNHTTASIATGDWGGVGGKYGQVKGGPGELVETFFLANYGTYVTIVPCFRGITFEEY